MQSSVNQNVAKNVFESVGADNVSLDVVRLYEELSKKVSPSPDGLKSTLPAAVHHNQVVPGTPLPAEQAAQQATQNPQQAAPAAQGAKPAAANPQGVITPQQGVQKGANKKAGVYAPAKTPTTPYPSSSKKKRSGY